MSSPRRGRRLSSAMSTQPTAPPLAASRRLVLRPQDQRRSTASPPTSAQLQGQGDAGRQRREQVRLHAAVRRPREAAHASSTPKGFAVLGFPSNDFGGQEPGTAEEIQQFCKLTYGVTFPMFEKGVTKAGPGAVADLHLPRARPATCPRWNFQQIPRSTRRAMSSRSSPAR